MIKKMNKSPQNTLIITQEIEGEMLTINLDFPLKFEWKKIKSFKKYLTIEKSKESKARDYGTTSEMKKIQDGELDTLKQYITFNKDKVYHFQYLRQFHNEVERFLSNTMRDYLRLTYYTPEYKRLSDRISELYVKRTSDSYVKSKDEDKKLQDEIKLLENQRDAVKEEQLKSFREQKKGDFQVLRRKLWKMWEQVELYFKYQKKKIEFEIMELEQELGKNVKVIKELKDEKEKFNVKINELRDFHKKYKDPDTIIELAEDREHLVSLLNLYEDYIRRELPKKIKEKKQKEKKKKSKEVTKRSKSKLKNKKHLYLRSILSSAIIDSNHLKTGNRSNGSKRLQLKFDIERIYQEFCSYLADSSQNKILIKKPYKFKDSYLVNRYTNEEWDFSTHTREEIQFFLEAFLSKRDLLKDKVIKTKQFGELLGLKLNFIEMVSIVFNNFFINLHSNNVIK